MIKKVLLLFILFCYLLPLEAQEEASLDYAISFRTEIEKPMRTLIKRTSDLFLQKSKIPLQSKEGLQRRAESSLPQIRKVLQSFGYFSGFATFEVLEIEGEINVFIDIEKGPQFTIGQVDIIYTSPPEALPLPSFADLGVETGAPANSTAILAAKSRLYAILEENGYGLLKEIRFQTVVDPDTDTMDLFLEIDPGPKLYFKETRIEGNKRVNTSFIEGKLLYLSGELFSRKKVQESIRKLQRTELFSYISLQLDEEATEDGAAVMLLEVKETPFRSLGAGIGYSTSLGPLALLEWEHRNIGNNGQRLSWELNYSPRLRETFLQYKIPDFAVSEQNLIFVGALKKESNRAFDSKEASISGLIERPIGDSVFFQFESRLSKTVARDNEDKFRRYSLAFPLRFNIDLTDNMLSPTRGVNPKIKLTPHITILDHNITHLNVETSLAHYYALTKDKRWILATKLNVGTIQGAKRADILPQERFYGGSSSLLRGYPFKTVSPLDIENKPLGGRSYATLTKEIRAKIGEDWGIVLFTEAGNVYESPSPNITKKLLWSAGIGAFYETPIGPLRFDLAGPLIRRPGFSGKKFQDPFQVYFTLGHAF